jgi:hypothetical protein
MKIVILLVFTQIVGLSAFGQTASRKERSGRELSVSVYFTNPELPGYRDDCGDGGFVIRKIPATRRVADAALKLLFAGPTEEEKAKGLESLAPLGSFYLGVSIKNGTATVNFRPGAEKYLYVSGGLCDQARALTPIDKTLKQFSSVKSVVYAINGKIIEDWDV